MKEPVCNKCHQICDVRDVDPGMHDANGHHILTNLPTGESFCCRAGYTMMNLAEQIQQEELASREAQRGARPMSEVDVFETVAQGFDRIFNNRG